MRVLVVNAGSSSLKLALVAEPGDEVLAATEVPRGADASRHAADDALADGLSRVGADASDAVGHRVVHGGGRVEPAMLDDALLDEIERLDALAPLHNAVAAAAVRELRERLPGRPQVACFDTAFHATLPPEARTYALPPEWTRRLGIRRHGFHGLSVAWSVERAAALLGRTPADLQLVIAHLGSGASVTAVRDGRSVATSMGMTPLEGLVMGTRSGSVDPGILLALLADGVPPEDLADGIAHRSGLLGLAGTADVRELVAAAAAGESPARLALDLFAARAAAETAGVATALDRLDAVVFTGGIGANAGSVRSAIARRLGILGVRAPAPEPSATGDRVLTAGGPAGGPALLVIEAREELVIARQVAAMMTKAPA